MVKIALSTLRHLGYGLRALFFIEPPANRPHAIGPEPLLIVLLALGLEIGNDVITTGQPTTLKGVALSLAGFAALVGWLFLVGVRARTGDAARFLATLIASGFWLSLIIVTVTLLGAHSEFLSPGLAQVVFGFAVVFFVLAWLLSSAFVLGVHDSAGRSLRFGLAAAFAVLCSFVIQLAGTPGVAAWATLLLKAPSEEQVGDVTPVNAERTFARQAELIDAQLDQLTPPRADRANVYFVGMATYASQDVFQREINSAREIVDERLGARGHSVVMVNHRDSAATLPLATATNLERVLYRLAQVMEPERDHLMLFVTTHGSEGVLSVDFPGFPLDNLTPQMLRDILDRTGIKNRILVISACYSGSFIPKLEGPDTLILTAARADRVSFGCSNERDWTYFGDALFNHALRETTSLTAAFERAKALVAEWETREKMAPPSEPQISIGANMAAKLEKLRGPTAERASSNP